MPGTGKTYLANCISELYGLDECKVVAPTGKAAELHDGGNTAHSAFNLPIKGKILKTLSREQYTAMKLKYRNMRILIIDEISMLNATFLSLISERLQELFNNNSPFGGINVILIGDFLQLPPVGKWLIEEAMVHHSLDGLLFRMFRLSILNQQMRAAEDIVHTTLLQRLSDPIRYPKPLDGLDLFCATCIHCANSTGGRHTVPVDHQMNSPTCPDICPHRCTHLKVLSAADITHDTAWINATIVTPTNAAVNRINLQRLVAYAKRSGQPVIRWLLPSCSKTGTFT